MGHSPAAAPAYGGVPAVETRDLKRVFKGSRGSPEVVALAGVDLRIERGEVFGLLGPNGAGKTTAIKILNTLLYPTSGEARVAGHDVVREAAEVRRRIALVSGGESSGYGILNVRECLWMFSQFYGVPRAEADARVDRLIETLGLKDLAKTRINRLSTGQRQRMNFARGFVSDPEILFLDEPTLGMDVNAARELREFVLTWVRESPGRTVLLTTHYMAEADMMCDRIAIIDRGRTLACDAPSALRRAVEGGQHVELEVLGVPEGLADVDGIAVTWGAPHPERGTHTMKLRLADGGRLPLVLRALDARGVSVRGVSTRETSLEDAFIAIVGRGLDDSEAPR
jgi:ABC-2 type transport system ATP-binding protein